MPVIVTPTNGLVEINPANAIEMLNMGDHELAIHEFSIDSPVSARDGVTNQQLYNIRFVIGTNNQPALDFSSGSAQCRIPPDLNADPSYCYVNSFEIVCPSWECSD